MLRLNMIWKTIPGFSNYEISENGQIRRSINSTAKGRGWWQKKPGELLNLFIGHGNDYLSVKLCKDDRKNKVYQIHVLVAISFHGPKKEPHLCALHKDDNKYNNHYSNIYWGTKGNNAVDRSKNGKCGRAKLSPDQIRSIRLMYINGALQRQIGGIFNIKQNTVSHII